MLQKWFGLPLGKFNNKVLIIWGNTVTNSITYFPTSFSSTHYNITANLFWAAGSPSFGEYSIGVGHKAVSTCWLQYKVSSGCTYLAIGY